MDNNIHIRQYVAFNSLATDKFMCPFFSSIEEARIFIEHMRAQQNAHNKTTA